MGNGNGKRTNARKTAGGVDPLLVSVSLGATIPVGEFQNIRPSVEIRNIRLDRPVEPQLKLALAAARQAWLAVDSEMEVQITEMVSGVAGQKTMADTIAELREWVDGVARTSFKNIAAEVKKQKERLDKLEKKESKTRGKTKAS